MTFRPPPAISVGSWCGISKSPYFTTCCAVTKTRNQLLGNHESYGDEQRSVGFLDQAGFRYLDNRWVKLAPGLILAGVDFVSRLERGSPSGDLIDRALSGRPVGATILLAHSPSTLTAQRAAQTGVELMLSEHTHGGQIWPFGYLVRILYPLLAGRYHVDGMEVIVSRGTATWGPPMRLWRRGDILKITLHSPEAVNGLRI